MPPNPATLARLEPHRRVLGACWVLYGIARVLMAFWLFAIIGTSTVMFGALLARVPEPFTWMSAFHFVYAVAIIWSALCGIFGILAGMALLAGQAAARKFALLAAFFAVSEIPFGTTLGIYTLIIFLP